MLKHTISLIVMCLNFLVQAQGYFNNTYVQPNINGANAVIEIDSGYLVVGQQPTTIQRKMIFYKLDKQGDTVFVKEYVDGLKIFYPCKIIQQAKNYLVFGSMKDSADIDNSDLFLASFDENLNLNWMKRYGGQYFDNGKDFHQLSNGDLVLAGAFSLDSSNRENFYLVKTDSAGNIKWEKNYGLDSKTEAANSVVPISDGSYLLSGYTYNAPTPDTLGNYDIKLIRVDSTGHLIWEKKYSFNLDATSKIIDDFGGGAIELSDKSILISISSSIGMFANSSYAGLLKIDTAGNFIWSKFYELGLLTAFQSEPLELEDRTLILPGAIKYKPNGISGWLVKLDPLGEIIWQRDYFTDSTSSQYIYDLKPTSDGGYVFCGFAFDSTSTQRAWVVKLDCLGCDSLLCYYEDSICEPFVSVPEWKSTFSEPWLYPNPNNGNFTIEWQQAETYREVTLSDAHGKIVYRARIKSGEEIQTGLSSGFYLMEMDGIRRKIIVEE